MTLKCSRSLLSAPLFQPRLMICEPLSWCSISIRRQTIQSASRVLPSFSLRALMNCALMASTTRTQSPACPLFCLNQEAKVVVSTFNGVAPVCNMKCHSLAVASLFSASLISIHSASQWCVCECDAGTPGSFMMSRALSRRLLQHGAPDSAYELKEAFTCFSRPHLVI